MITVAGVPLALPQSATAAGFSVDLGELLYCGQAVSSSPGGDVPPARPPWRYEYAPGTLYWPAGASRFALGQYLLTDTEVRSIWPDGFTTDALTLTLGGTGTGQLPVAFTLYSLILLPLQLDRSAVVPPANCRALYLLLLVDGRYFFQTAAPDWTIDEGTTTWSDLDADLLDFLGAGSSAASVVAAYLKPSAGLAPPPQASSGSPGWCGPLLDTICLASGRRFIAHTDGTYALQSWADADTSFAASLAANEERLRAGGLLAFPPEDEPTDGLYVVPTSITLVYPERDATPAEGAPYTSTQTFAALRAAAGYAATDTPCLEDDLRILTDLWADGSNDAALNTHAAQWATDWYAWLRGKALLVYAGCVDFDPDGTTDSITWLADGEDAWTRVERGLLNPRPNVAVGGYSGVVPLGPVFPYGAVFLGPVYFYNGPVEFHDLTLTIDNSTVNITNSTVNLAASTTVNNAAVNIYTGPQQYPLYDYSGTPLAGPVVTNFTIPAGNARIKISSDMEYVYLASIAGGTSGRLIYWYNVGEYTILWPNEYTPEATASRRILTTDLNFYFHSPRECVATIYDGGSSRWRISENSHKRLCKVHTYEQWTTDQDNVTLLPDVELHRVSSNAEINWAAVRYGLDGLRHRVMNTGFFTIWILNNSANGDAGGRFELPDYQTSLPLRPGQEMWIEYDLTGSPTGEGVWRPVCLYPDPAEPVDVDVVTSVCLTVGDDLAGASTTTALTSTTWADLTGCTLTFTVAKQAFYLITGVFDLDGNGTAEVTYDMAGPGSLDTYAGALMVDGVREAGYAIFSPAHPRARATVAQAWIVELAEGSHTLKLQGRRESGTGQAVANTNTTLLYQAEPVAAPCRSSPCRSPAAPWARPTAPTTPRTAARAAAPGPARAAPAQASRPPAAPATRCPSPCTPPSPGALATATASTAKP